MGFGCLFSIFFGFLLSSSLLLGTTNWEALVVVSDFSGVNPSVVVPIPIPSDTAGTSTTVGVRASSIAITPDGTTALVASYSDGNVAVLDLTQPPPFPSYTVSVGNAPSSIAITSDGSTALVTNADDGTVSVLDLTQSPIGPGYAVPVGEDPEYVAISPDGNFAIVSNNYSETVTVLKLRPSVGVVYSISVGNGPLGVAYTPDGTKALVTLRNNNAVAVLDVTQSPIQLAYTVPVGDLPTGIAITSDGAKALVVNDLGPTVSVLDLTQPVITQGYEVVVGENPVDVAITPDGARAYVTNAIGRSVSVLDVTQTPIVPIHAPIPMPNLAFSIAITPDQAPTAVFTTSVNGLTVSFDGSGSSSPVGNVRKYIWDFGDGSDPITTTSATVSHTYARSGAYTVSLTVVNDAGTSLDITFTGKTVSNRGLPRARSTQTLTLAPLAPLSFTGKVQIDKHEKQIVLQTKWQPSGDNDTWSYEIFAHNEKIAVFDANKGNCATITLHPHHFPKEITSKYLQYLEHKYAIRGVNTDGVATSLVYVQIER